MPDAVASRSAAIILAAGKSARMGSPKQLLDFRGKPLLRHVSEIACAAATHPVVVVLGSRSEQIRPVLDDLNLQIVVNDRWTEGMGTSICKGLEALSSASTSGTILMLADQPFITPTFLRLLVERHHQTGKSIVSAAYSGTVGVPVFFARSAFHFLEKMEPGQGCKGVIVKNMPDVHSEPCPEAAIDIDTPEDYSRNV